MVDSTNDTNIFSSAWDSVSNAWDDFSFSDAAEAYFMDDEGNIDWSQVGKAGTATYALYSAYDSYKNANEAGDMAGKSLALEQMLAVTNKDLAIAGFELQRDAFNASLAIEAKKMGYWEEAQKLNKNIADTKFSWYKKLQPFALDKERYDEALRTNNLAVLDAQTAHVQEVLLDSGDELGDIYRDQSELYADQRTSLDDYETRVLGAIERIGEREQISNEDIMRDYGMLYEENMGELNNLIDRVNTRGYAESYNNGMSRSTLEDDRSRDLVKKYADDIQKTKNLSYDQAIDRNTKKDSLFNTNRSGILSEAGNSSILDQYTKSLDNSGKLFNSANSIVTRDYDFANALNQLKGGQMINTTSGSPAAMTSAAPSGTSYNSNAASLLGQAGSAQSSYGKAYAGLASANALAQGKGMGDFFDLFTSTQTEEEEDTTP